MVLGEYVLFDDEVEILNGLDVGDIFCLGVLLMFLEKEVSVAVLRFTGFFEVLVIEILDDRRGVTSDEPKITNRVQL